MNKGARTIIYPVRDLKRAKASFSKFLGLEPYVDSTYYVGFKVGDLDIGLDPNGHKSGMTAYYHVDDIVASKQSFLDSGAEIIQDIREVGEGRRVASLKDVEGNIIGLIQDS